MANTNITNKQLSNINRKYNSIDAVPKKQPIKLEYLNSNEAMKSGYISSTNVYGANTVTSKNEFNIYSGTTAITKFPFDLEYRRSMKIKVYGATSFEQAFDGLVGSTKNAIEKLKSYLTGGGISASVSSSVSDVVKIGSSINEIKTSTFSFPISQALPDDFGNGKLTKVFKDTIYLPIPNGLSEMLSNNYSEDVGWVSDLGNAAVAIADMIPAGRVGTLAKTALNAGSGAAATFAKATGSRRVDYYENKIQMYNGTAFRNITLSWDFVPNNRMEANAIFEIIRKMKKYASPSTFGGRLLMNEPDFFCLEFANKNLNEMLNFTEVVLVDASYEYVPGGNMEMYHQDVPKHIQVSFTFRDRQPKVQEDWIADPSCEGTDSNSPTC